MAKFLNVYSNRTNSNYEYEVFNVRTAEDCFMILENYYYNTHQNRKDCDDIRRFSLQDIAGPKRFEEVNCTYVAHKCFIIMDCNCNPVDSYFDNEWEEN